MATKKRGPRSAGDRVAKLLVIIPWLVKRKRVKLVDVAREFDMSVDDLVEDIMLASLCGVPPYSRSPVRSTVPPRARAIAWKP